MTSVLTDKHIFVVWQKIQISIIFRYRFAEFLFFWNLKINILGSILI